MYSYAAFRLNIRSELALPSLMPGQGPADVVVRLGQVCCVRLETATSATTFHATPEEACLFWPRVGRFQVRKGCEVVVDPDPEAEEETVRLFLMGPVLAVVLHQRGLLVLHGSAVAVDGGCVAFLGWPGQGKSTLATAMYRRGHSVVADDLLAVDLSGIGRPVVIPGFPQVKLWPDSAAALVDNADALPRVHPSLAKRTAKACRGFSQRPLPLGRIYVLGQAQEQSIQAVPGRERVIELVRHSHPRPLRLTEATDALPEHFQHCVRLASAVPIHRLERPFSLDNLSDLVQMVEQDVRHSEDWPGGERVMQ